MSADGVFDILQKVGALNSASTDVYSLSTIGTSSNPVETARVVNTPIGLGGPEAITFDSGSPIPDQSSITKDTPYTLDISSKFTTGFPPKAYAIHSGSLPPGLALHASTGVVSGTPTTVGGPSTVVFKATDSRGNSANSNSVNFTVVPNSISPDLLPGLTLWLDPTLASTMYAVSGDASPVSVDGTAVALIKTRSATQHGFAQATVANKPLYKTNVKNGKSVLRFDGVNDSLGYAAWSETSTIGAATASSGLVGVSATGTGWTSISAVAIPDCAATGPTYVNDTIIAFCSPSREANVSVQPFDSTTMYAVGTVNAATTGYAAAYNNTPGVGKTVWCIVTAMHDIANSLMKVRVNGGAWVTTAAVGAGPNYTSQALMGTPFNLAQFLQMDLGQQVVYSNPMSDANVTLVENYMAELLGIVY